MTNPHGSFIWYELMTSDPKAAAAFYAKVLGWRVAPFHDQASTGAYDIITAPDGNSVGGMMAPPEGGPPPAWFGYIGVDDVDACAADVTAKGGSVHMPPTTIEGVGRLAMVADPQGAMFYIMRGASEGDSSAFSPDPQAICHCTWNELVAVDQDAVLPFYSGLFGWEKSGAMPMGEMGDYSFLTHAGLAIGAMMNRQDAAQPPRFQFHFRVADLDAAMAAVTAAGGTLLYGPHDVPGGERVAFASDPQGAVFGMVHRAG